MKLRTLIAPTAIALIAFAAACDSGTDGKSHGKPTAGTPAGQPSAAATAGDTKPASEPSADMFGKGVIKATVKFTGTAPEMKVPAKRKDAEFCKDKDVVYNAVVVNDGKLQDVLVGIAPGQLSGEYEASKPAVIDQVDCMYTPRLQGVVIGQSMEIKNSDPTLHNVNAGMGAETLFNTAQPKGAPALTKEAEEPGVMRFKCDVHSWMRSFVYVSDNPFHGVTGADGAVSIEKVPAGKYKVMAWHSQYGAKEKEIEVKDGEVTVEFEYNGEESAPDENKGELDGLF